MGGQAEFRKLQTGIFCDFSSGGDPNTIYQLNRVCLVCLPHLALCLVTFWLTNMLLLPRETLRLLSPASPSLCTHLYCAKERSAEIPQNYPSITSAQCCPSWQVPLAHAQHPTGIAWLFLAQEPRPVLCWLVPPCSW